MLKTISELRSQGWEALVAKLGAVEATRFMLEFQSGTGDYTRERQEIFKNISLDEIVADIKKLYPAEDKGKRKRSRK